MNKKAKKLLAELCRQYDQLTIANEKRFFPSFNAWITTDKGANVCYIRRMIASQRICLANIRFPLETQKQGVFGEFIQYIRENPHYYTGIEVESIENPKLAAYLLRSGWKHIPNLSELEKLISPTLYLEF